MLPELPTICRCANMGNCLQPELYPVEYFTDLDDVEITEMCDTDDGIKLSVSYKQHTFTFWKYNNGSTTLEYPGRGTCIYKTMDDYFAAMDRVVNGGDLLVRTQKHSISATIWPDIDHPGRKELRFSFLGFTPAEASRYADMLKKHLEIVSKDITLGSMTLRQQMIARVTNQQLAALKSTQSSVLEIRWTDLTQRSGGGKN